MNLQSLFGLSSAISFGTGDFCGALSTKKTPALTVVVFSQIISGIMLLLLCLFSGSSIPEPIILLRSGAAGLIGGLSLIGFYSALASGHIAIAAPLTAVLSCAVPSLFGFFRLGLPSVIASLGFACALASILLLNATGKREKIHRGVIIKSIGAGVGFGLFFLLTAGIPGDLVLPSLFTARICSVAILSLIGVFAKTLMLPKRKSLLLIGAAGLFDTGGNALYIVSSSFGRFDTAVILASLYPAVTVILSAIILKEKISLLKIIGGILALAAVIMLTSGA